MENFRKNYAIPLISGGVTIGFGIFSKQVFKKEIINVSSPQKIIEDFLLVSISGMIAKEIYDMITITPAEKLFSAKEFGKGSTPWNPLHYPDKKEFYTSPKN